MAIFPSFVGYLFVPPLNSSFIKYSFSAKKKGYLYVPPWIWVSEILIQCKKKLWNKCPANNNNNKAPWYKRTSALGTHLQVDQSIVKLLEEEKTWSHTLAPRNCVAFTGRRAHKLEQSLRLFDKVFEIELLPISCQRHSLQNEFLWRSRLQWLDNFISLLRF